MNREQIVSCVPNFSEGYDMQVIHEICDEIKKTSGVKLIDIDPGKATNRTVVTFIGNPDSVVEAAFNAIKKASELIDMSKHKGEHPRMGATDVCPMIPIAYISMEETAKYARRLGKMVGDQLDISVFLYENAATNPERKNLATIRSGEYEGMEVKLKDPKWTPDFGPSVLNVKAGVTAIGARELLVAYNVNLNTKSVRRANSVAFDIRENGRIKTDSATGKNILDQSGEPERIPGKCKSVKAIGWFIEEYDIAQISMNLTDIKATPLHVAFEECCISATNRGLRVTGSELVGVLPKAVLLEAGRYFLKKQNRSIGVSESELIHIAVKSLGLDDLAPFDPRKKIMEYLLDDGSNSELVSKSLVGFADQTASESPAPGGGSVSAYVGSLGISLGAMVANLSAHKTGWDDKVEYFSEMAHNAQMLKETLLKLVDQDTFAFNKIIEAIRLPKNSDYEKSIRNEAINSATKHAIDIPFQIMQVSVKSMEILKEMAKFGNPNSVSDAAVGALCARTAVQGGFLNVQINCLDFKEQDYVDEILNKANVIMSQAFNLEKETLDIVNKILEK